MNWLAKFFKQHPHFSSNISFFTHIFTEQKIKIQINRLKESKTKNFRKGF